MDSDLIPRFVKILEFSENFLDIVFSIKRNAFKQNLKSQVRSTRRIGDSESHSTNRNYGTTTLHNVFFFQKLYISVLNGAVAFQFFWMDINLFSGNCFHHFENSGTGSSESMSMPEANLFPTQFPHSKFSFQSSNYSFEKRMILTLKDLEQLVSIW